MVKNIQKYLIYPLALFSLFGCKGLEFVEENFPKADNYDVFISISPGKESSLEVVIGTYSGRKYSFSEGIQAMDWETDGRIDEFVIYAEKGSKLEKFASIEEINKIVEAVLEDKSINKKTKK